MLVYRVLHKRTKYGPYCHSERDGIRYIMNRQHSDSCNHPILHNFSISRRRSGFESKAQLKQWFSGYIEDLHKLGYIVNIYQVAEKHTQADGYQVLFDRSKAKLVETKELISL